MLSGHAALRQGVAAVVRGAGVHVIESDDYSPRSRRADVAIIDLDHAPGDSMNLLLGLRAQLEGTYLAVLGSPTRIAASADDRTEAGADAELEASRADSNALLAVVARRAPRPSSELSRARRQWAEVTRRQRDVLRWLALGHDNQTIAARLRVSERAVKAHVSALLALFGCSNRTQLALLANRAGLRPLR